VEIPHRLSPYHFLRQAVRDDKGLGFDGEAVKDLYPHHGMPATKKKQGIVFISIQVLYLE
jgi:hypothetical protein